MKTFKEYFKFLTEMPVSMYNVKCPYDNVYIDNQDVKIELMNLPKNKKNDITIQYLSSNLRPVVCPNPFCPGKLFMHDIQSKENFKTQIDDEQKKLFLDNFKNIEVGSFPKIVSFDVDNTIIKLKWDSIENDFQRSKNGDQIETANDEIIQLMKKLKKDNFGIYVVTSRYESLREETEEMLDKFNVPYSQLFMTNGALKANTLERLGVSIHFDDSEDELNELKNTNIIGMTPWDKRIENYK